MKAAHIFFGILLVAIGAFAQEHPTVTAQPNSVYVGADGKFEAAPDTALIQLNVSVQDESPQAAFQKASKNVEQVRQVIHANGLDTKALNVGFLSVQPVYEWKPKQRVIGYRVTTDLALKLKDFSKIGSITQQLAEANVSETQTLNYILENMVSHERIANRGISTQDCRREAHTDAHSGCRCVSSGEFAESIWMEASLAYLLVPFGSLLDESHRGVSVSEFP